MKLILRGHDCRYACEQMMLTLFPGERPVYEGEGLPRLRPRAHDRADGRTSFRRAGAAKSAETGLFPGGL